MTTAIIDGTLIDSEVGRSRPNKFTIFKSLTFQRNDGSTEVLKRQVVNAEIAEKLKPGASGRFYTFKALDMKGVHGIRLKDGTTLHKYHGANLMLFPVLGAINLAWIILMIITRDSVPMLGVFVLGLAIVGYFVTRKSIMETKRQFDADSGEPAAAQKTVAKVVTSPVIDAV